MTEKDRKEEIHNWVNLAKKVHGERSKEEMNILFDIRPVESFEISLKHAKGNKILDDKFIEMFGEKVKISIPFGTSSKEKVKLLNPIIKKNTSKYLLCVREVVEDVFLLIPENISKEVESCEFLRSD